MTEERLLTVSELARFLQVPDQTLYGWRTQGKGPHAFKVGRHLRYRARDVEMWLEAKGDPGKGGI
jgi:excisionase family DNA binding protein